MMRFWPRFIRESMQVCEHILPVLGEVLGTIMQKGENIVQEAELEKVNLCSIDKNHIFQTKVQKIKTRSHFFQL